jgi:hypothetical protein
LLGPLLGLLLGSFLRLLLRSFLRLLLRSLLGLLLGSFLRLLLRLHILRGGSVNNAPAGVRSAGRAGVAPSFRSLFDGFRPARTCP